VRTPFKGISVWRDRGALVTFRFQCAAYKSIHLLIYPLVTNELPVTSVNRAGAVTFTCKK